jgi:hypothetical protein
MQEPDSDDAELAQWLQEAGRRRLAPKAAPLPEMIGEAKAAATPKRVYIRRPRLMILLAIAALSYLPYYYAGVYVQISSLPGVIVFV